MRGLENLARAVKIELDGNSGDISRSFDNRRELLDSPALSTEAKEHPPHG